MVDFIPIKLDTGKLFIDSLSSVYLAGMTIDFKKDKQDTRVKHVFLSKKGEEIFNEIFTIQKKRIYNALLNSKSDEVVNFDNVLSKIING